MKNPPLIEFPETYPYDGDLLRYKVQFSAMLDRPIIGLTRQVPCACKGWKVAVKRRLGRHPLTHRVPAFSVLTP